MRSLKSVNREDQPGIRWGLAFTIAAEIGDIGRFASPKKLAGYTWRSNSPDPLAEEAMET